MDGVAPDKPLDSAVLSRLKQFSAMNKLKRIAIRVSSYLPSKLVMTIPENLSYEMFFMGALPF